MVEKSVIIALGGNALAPSTGSGTIAEQFAQTRASMKVIMPFVRQGFGVAITHGNGPQVGDELRRVELSEGKVPALPLGVAVAATQGTIGYMIEQSLQNALLDEDIHRDVVSLITQVLVRADDPAITRPTKFIGEHYPQARAEELSRKYGWHIGEQSEGIWRRVVGSPTPLRINNGVSIKRMVDAGTIVIAAGGGGIPTYVDQHGRYEGVDAVIDKDLAAAVLGATIEAAELYIITDVPAVYLDFGTKDQHALRKLHVDEADRHLKAGQFPPGNMGPKISAAIQFIQQGGKQVLLTDIASIEQALANAAGTIIYS